jgi:iron complex outermembrane recepter protein
MFLRRIYLLALLLTCSVATAMAQAGKVSGRLTDNQKKPVPFATITLLRSDSSVAGGFLTEEDGKFLIETQGLGNYILRVSGIGMKTRTVNNISLTAEQPEKNLGDVTVSMTAQSLKEVEITGEKAMMEMSIDKKVFNVDKNITTAGGSASDVLQNVPSISVDVDGSVSLRGKSGALILIDGKPATLLGGDAASALQSLPAASVQSVEVITNPSAKYDAQGVTGIINIITKRDKKFGLNGSVTAGAGTRDKYNGSLNLNIKNKSWNIFLNSSFRQNRNYNRTTTDRQNFNNSSTYNTYEDNTRTFGGSFNSLGAEYMINEKNSITLTQNINRMTWGGKGYSIYSIYSSPEHKESVQRRSTYNLGGPLSSSTSLDYKHKFKERQEITANATYATTWVTREQEYETNVYDGVGGLKSGPVKQHAPGRGGNSSLNAQTDFTTPFLTAKGKLDAGLKTQLFSFNSANTPTIDSGTGAQVDYVLLNNYDYTQETHAAYTSYSDQKGKWSYQGGLRLEYALYEGTAYSLKGKRYSNEFLNLFPSAFVSYKMPKDQTMNLNYSRRINRPGFMQLMPYVDLSNPQDTNIGNPNLIPEFIHNTELSYNRSFKKGHNFIASVYYQQTQNMIERYRRFYADGTTFTQPQNLNSGTTYGLEMIGKAQLNKIWDATLSVNLFQNEIKGINIDPSLNNSGFSWFAKGNTNIKLPAGFSVQLNGNYEAPKIAGQGRLKEVYWVDAAVKKNLLKNKATLTANVSDIFNTRKYTTIYEYPSYVQSMYRDRETRIGNISFTYRFGKSETGPKTPDTRGNGRRKQNNDKEKDKERQNLKSDEGGGGNEGNF